MEVYSKLKSSECVVTFSKRHFSLPFLGMFVCGFFTELIWENHLHGTWLVSCLSISTVYIINVVILGKYREVRISAQNWNFQMNEFRTLTIVLGLKCKAASTQRAGGGQSINRRWCTMYMRPRGGHWTQFNLATAKTDWPIGPREAVQSRNRPLVTNPSSSSGHLNVLVAITGALVLDACFRFRS